MLSKGLIQAALLGQVLNDLGYRTPCARMRLRGEAEEREVTGKLGPPLPHGLAPHVHTVTGSSNSATSDGLPFPTSVITPVRNRNARGKRSPGNVHTARTLPRAKDLSTKVRSPPWEAKGVPKPPSPPRRAESKGSKKGKGAGGSGKSGKGKGPLHGENRQGPVRPDVKWRKVMAGESGPADPRATPQDYRVVRFDSELTYAKVSFNDKDQMVNVFGGHRDFIPRAELEVMVCKDVKDGYNCWLAEQASFEAAVQRGQVGFPLHPTLGFQPECDRGVDEAETRVYTKTGDVECVCLLDGSPCTLR